MPRTMPKSPKPEARNQPGRKPDRRSEPGRYPLDRREATRTGELARARAAGATHDESPGRAAMAAFRNRG